MSSQDLDTPMVFFRYDLVQILLSLIPAPLPHYIFADIRTFFNVSLKKEPINLMCPEFLSKPRVTNCDRKRSSMVNPPPFPLSHQTTPCIKSFPAPFPAVCTNEIKHAAQVLSRYRDARRTRILRIRLRLTVRVKKHPLSD